MKRRLIKNSAKCYGCMHCADTANKNRVYCDLRNKDYFIGQYIDPCDEYEKKKGIEE